MRDLTNISSLIGSLNQNNNNFINLTDYSSIKSGSYKKLMKAYYAEEAKTNKAQNTAKKDNTQKTKTSKVKTQADNPELTKTKANADKLKESASKLSQKSLWEKKDDKLDTKAIKESVKDFVKSYNDVIEQSKKSGSKEVEKNTKWMTDLSDTLSKTLDKVGVKVGDDKKLTFDEEKFDKAKESTLESMFKGTYSYAGQIEAKASGIASASLMQTSTYEKDASTTASLASLFNTNI
ncbi:MAG: hypothetical protein J5717_00045 [Lachnospiraceae bacterium]|nr:hypothetical protein [Lachnospiraceae bacterium]